MTILSEEQHAFFVENGYVTVSGVVPPENLQAAIKAICEFLKIDSDDPNAWYHIDLGPNGIVPLHHAQAFWDNRQHPKVYQVFSELLGIRELWVTMDRGSFKPPFRREWPELQDDSPLHWDRDPHDPRGSWIQGLLYLTDTSAEQGAFQCVPKIHRLPDRWASKLDEDNFLVPKEIDESEAVNVVGAAGTLILWDSRLPHRGGLNHTDQPRFAQAIAMHPVGHEEERRERVQLWRDKRAPSWWRPWPNQLDPEPGEPAKLTPLGRKLVGLDRW